MSMKILRKHFFKFIKYVLGIQQLYQSYLSLPSKSLLSGDSCTTKTKFIQTKYSIMSLAKLKYQTDKLYLLIFHFSSHIAIIFNLFLQIILFQCTIKICNSLKHYTVETKQHNVDSFKFISVPINSVFIQIFLHENFELFEAMTE